MRLDKDSRPVYQAFILLGAVENESQISIIWTFFQAKSDGIISTISGDQAAVAFATPDWFCICEIQYTHLGR